MQAQTQPSLPPSQLRRDSRFIVGQLRAASMNKAAPEVRYAAGGGLV